VTVELMFRPPAASMICASEAAVLRGSWGLALGSLYDALVVEVMPLHPGAQLPLHPEVHSPRLPVEADTFTTVSDPAWWPEGGGPSAFTHHEMGGIVSIGDASWRFRDLIDRVHERAPGAFLSRRVFRIGKGAFAALSMASGLALVVLPIAALPLVGLAILTGVGTYAYKDVAKLMNVDGLNGEARHLYALAGDATLSNVGRVDGASGGLTGGHRLSTLINSIFGVGDRPVGLSEKSAPVAIALWYHYALQKFRSADADEFARALHLGKMVKIGDGDFQDLVALMDVMPMMYSYKLAPDKFIHVMDILRLHRRLPVALRSDHRQIVDVVEIPS
jgi:hypothetical protein